MCDLSLWKKCIPLIERKIRVGAANTCNEVVFEGANATFCSIATMIVGKNELEVDFLHLHT